MDLQLLTAFFLVDPLDGTKEFLKTNNKGAFTVNIGLVEGGVPVMGIVYAPALDRLFLVRKMRVRLKCSVISAARLKFESRLQSRWTAVASVSHRDKATNDWLQALGHL